MCWIAREAGASVRLDGETQVVQTTHERILHELYGLTPAQVHLYDRISTVVDEALEQFDMGYAVCVEEQMADLAKELAP